MLSYHYLVESIIVGCEGTSAGHRTVIKATRRGALAIYRKGLRSFTEGSIEGSSRDYDLFNRGSLLKCPTFEGHDCFSEVNK